MSKPFVSIIIPTLNEVDVICKTLKELQYLRALNIELILADGGSTDGTASQVQPLVDRIICAPKGRARQMNSGAEAATGEWLMFLHADTHLPKNIDQWLTALKNNVSVWGFFSLKLDGAHRFFRCIEYMINQRSRITRVATGDQCLFMRKQSFKAVGNYPDIPLMEDVAISKKLRKISKPFLWKNPVVTSSRRWEVRGIYRTVLLMWRLRLAYFLGVSPHTLHKAYYD